MANKETMRVKKRAEARPAGSRMGVAMEYVGVIAIACLFIGAVIGWSVAPKSAPGKSSLKPPAGMMGGMNTDAAVQATMQQVEHETDGKALADIGNNAYDSVRSSQNIAINAYEKSLAMRPNDPMVMTDLAAMYLSDSQPAQAIKLTRTAVQIDPKLPQARYWLGMALAQAGNKAAAAQAFQEVGKVAPGSAMAKEADKQLGLLNSPH